MPAQAINFLTSILELSVRISNGTPTIVTEESSLLWHVTPCSSERIKRIEEYYHFYLQDSRTSRGRNQQNHIVGLLFKPDNRSDLFLLDVRLSPKDTTLQLRTTHSSDYFKSKISWLGFSSVPPAECQGIFQGTVLEGCHDCFFQTLVINNLLIFLQIGAILSALLGAS